MTKYRILEKTGTRWTGPSWNHGAGGACGPTVTRTIPRYIVQEATFPGWKDLKEFTSLAEARKYKLELELVEGKVIE